MKKYFIAILILTITANIFASPLHLKLHHTIIIDTDCSIHDLRAVSILLSNPGITIKSIIISDGQVEAKEGYKLMRDLLHKFKADTIPLFTGESTDLKNKQNSKDSKKTTRDYFTILPTGLFQIADTQLTLVCLGPLTNITREIDNNPTLRDRVDEVIWYVDSVNPFNGFNYESDKNSADRILNSGVRFDIVSNLNILTPVFDSELLNLCTRYKTNISNAILSLSSSLQSTKEKIDDLHTLSEELAALFIGNHELFVLNHLESNLNIRFNTEYSSIILKDVIRDLITGDYRSGHFVALYGFPVNPELYVYDVRHILEPAIERYGIEEWKACTLTDEFHGHLGVFSIVGAKMGIHAREYFGIGTDLLEIGSYAGSEEPFSCLNDGLQVSTGATLGQGSIHHMNDSIAKPQAVFTYKNQSILIKLKDEYLDQIKVIIARGIKNYGLQDEDYWNLIRQTSIKFWLEWDRREIFELIVIK